MTICPAPLDRRVNGVRRKTQHRTYVWQQLYGFVGTLDTGMPEITVSVAALIRH